MHYDFTNTTCTLPVNLTTGDTLTFGDTSQIYTVVGAAFTTNGKGVHVLSTACPMCDSVYELTVGSTVKGITRNCRLHRNLSRQIPVIDGDLTQWGGFKNPWPPYKNKSGRFTYHGMPLSDSDARQILNWYNEGKIMTLEELDRFTDYGEKPIRFISIEDML